MSSKSDECPFCGESMDRWSEEDTEKLMEENGMKDSEFVEASVVKCQNPRCVLNE